MPKEQTQNPEALQTLTVTSEISPKALSNLKQHFKTVHYHPDPESVSDEVAWETEIWYTRWMGLPGRVERVEQVGKTRIVQLSSAGANIALKHKVLASEEGRKQIQVCSASGIHSLSIPQWCIAQIINIYMNIPVWHHRLTTDKKWPSLEERKSGSPGPIGQNAEKGSASLYGKTAGLLGYGHIAREAARQLKAFNVDVIAANSAGEAKVDDGYIIKGTGDRDGSLPSKYYSTTNEGSFKAFLKRCDILIASLPSTPQTQWLLKPEHLALLPTGAVFLNVGRGDLVHTEDLITALDAPDGLYAVALDVTDPEPLEPDSPLFSHPRAFITPHTSGDFAGYFDAGTELLIENVKRVREGRGAFNVVDPEKGY